jgi:hypothetical protein
MLLTWLQARSWPARARSPPQPKTSIAEPALSAAETSAGSSFSTLGRGRAKSPFSTAFGQMRIAVAMASIPRNALWHCAGPIQRPSAAAPHPQLQSIKFQLLLFVVGQGKDDGFSQGVATSPLERASPRNACYLERKSGSMAVSPANRSVGYSEICVRNLAARQHQ